MMYNMCEIREQFVTLTYVQGTHTYLLTYINIDALFYG